MGFIVLNMFILALSYEGSSPVMQNVLDKVNLALTGIFTIEVILKFIAFGGKFFTSGWNVFDLFVVLASLFDIVMTYGI